MSSLAPNHDVRRSLLGLTILPGWVLLGAVAALGAVRAVVAPGLTLPRSYQFLPLVASALVLGLPHGAVDHLTPARARNRRASIRDMAAVGVLYAVLGGLYAALWFVAPAAGFVVFILITWLHWGQGEVHALGAIAGVDHLDTPVQRLLTALARGTLPMLVPLVAFPGEYRFVAETLVGLFGGSLGPLTAVFTTTGRLVVAALVGSLLVVTLASGYLRTTSTRGWALDAGEVALLVVFFLSVEPILAVGLYFTCWHALRHVGRLLALDPDARQALADGDTPGALARFTVDATPLTLASLLLLGGLALLVPASPAGLADLVGLYLVLIAALTLPHVVVVTYLDRTQDVWTPGRMRLTGRDRPGGRDAGSRL
jgi:Brp/Blh family beta-carotene 15,15'-monooxygenase